MCEYECCSPWCWAIGILAAIAWWLFASGLLLCAWNSVIASIANVKKAKYWQALVIVLTVVVLFGPLCCGRRAWSHHKDGKGPVHADTKQSSVEAVRIGRCQLILWDIPVSSDQGIPGEQAAADVSRARVQRQRVAACQVLRTISGHSSSPSSAVQYPNRRFFVNA
jgi:hypothetical protein